MTNAIKLSELPSWVNKIDLRRLCEPHGTVLSSSVTRDSCGQSLGYGWVEMADAEEAKRASVAVHDTVQFGRRICAVALAQTTAHTRTTAELADAASNFGC